jgi:glycosyltransferase involved in cell wall biosynthesis
VIGSDLPASREWLRDGETGLLVEAGNSEALTTGLVRLVDDGTLRHAIGHRARVFVEQERRWAKIVERYPQIYEQALAERAVNGIGSTPIDEGIDESIEGIKEEL